jgi:hypothetical protein
MESARTMGIAGNLLNGRERIATALELLGITVPSLKRWGGGAGSREG